MFGKKQPVKTSARARHPSRTVNESFRRNNVVISTRQKEIAQRQQSVSQRQAEHKKLISKRRRKARVTMVVALVVLISLVQRMNISGVAIASNASSRLNQQQSQIYEESIASKVGGYTLLKQSWLLDTDALADDVIKSNPEIERITFSTSSPLSTTLKADIRFRKAVFTWRDASNTDQFVDSGGVLFAKNLDPSVNVAKLIRIEDQSGTVLETGTSVLTASIIAFIGQMHSKVTTLYGGKVSISRVVIPKSTREVQIQVASTPYLIKFNSTRNLNDQVGELQSLLVHLNTNKIIPATYIDLRVAHKAFYK